MKIAQTAEPPSFIFAIDTDDREAFPMRASETGTKSDLNAPDVTVIRHAFQQEDASAVRYKSPESRHFQISHHTVLNVAFALKVYDWKEWVELPDKFWKYYEEFVDILSEF